MIYYSNNTDSHAVRPFYFNDSVKQGTLCQRPPVPKDVFAGPSYYSTVNSPQNEHIYMFLYTSHDYLGVCHRPLY
jgi:hypothetical protein